jgi:hypothetical protein
MLPELEIELLNELLAERRRQSAADVEASTVAAMAASGPSLLERLFSLFRFDQTQAPVAQQSMLHLQCHSVR